MNKLLFKHIDNSALIIFRVFFGLLIFLESVGAIFTGWVRITLVEPKFTFSFMPFDWLQPLPGYGMYVYFFIMGVFGFFVMIGYKYRVSILAFTLMWASVYFMQKSSYNNHYYLLILLSAIMCVLPANRRFSVDAKQSSDIKSNNMPQWCSYIFIVQMAIVYTYASIAKWYPDWLDITVVKNLMANRKNYYVIGDLLQQQWVHYSLTYLGLFFDLLVVPMLLWKPTRKWAFIASLFFHLFNSIVFQIGIFPYMSIALLVFFYPPKTIKNIFFKNEIFYQAGEVKIPPYKNYLLPLFAVYFCVQIALPVRHWFIKDNVLWTEEGHRMAWRMMLRSKGGMVTYKVVDKNTGKKTRIKLRDYLSAKQRRTASTKPDVIWQFSQRLKREYALKGKDVSVYVDCKVSVNGRPYKRLIDEKTDLANVKWNTFGHNAWILPSKLD